MLLVTLDRPRVLNAMTYGMHAELARLWADVDRDPGTRVVVGTGAGRAFSSGNDVNNPELDYDGVRELMADAVRIVRGMVECEKPIVSAINGVAVGAGLAIAIMADVSVAAEDARLIDGHARLGVAAGDHACLIWPLLCGMAKAKYYLFDLDVLDGREAERIGLVSKACPAERVLDEAMAIAHKLAHGSQPAIRGTKRALNGWLRQALPIFEHSAALELVDFFGPDLKAAREAFRAKRPVAFPSAR
ncbi:MAG: enoyl-CoA hydratase/isomerase family protein [Alphaproteobacteria bacterium]